MTWLLAEISKPFIPGWETAGQMMRPFIAELVLILTLIAVLLVPFFTRRANWISGLVALGGLSLALLGLLIVRPWDEGVQFRGMLVSDPFAAFWKIILILFVMGVVLMWFSTTAGQMHEGDGPEFFTLMIGATLGMCMMASTSNLLMMFLAIETASLPSYVLAGFRKTHRLGSEASLKYVLFGAVCSAIMVYGMSWLYGLYGTLQLEAIGQQMSKDAGVPVMLALTGLVAGMGFKISAVPMHMWCPDVFEGAGIDVATFLSVASKGAGISMLLRACVSLAQGMGYGHTTALVSLAVVLGTLGALTATVGNLGAFVQDNIKRLLAYSSIAHAGYMLCTFGLLVAIDPQTGVRQGQGAAQALLLYLAVYLFMNLGAFTVAGLIAKETGSEDINDYAGMSRRNPVLAFCMTLCLFSLIGMPPLAGFVAKFNIIVVLAKSGGWLWALIGIIVLNTVFSLYYYVRVIRKMYLSDSDKPAVNANPLGTAVAVVCGAMLVLMLVAYNPVQRLTERYGKISVGRMEAPPQVAGDGYPAEARR
jgi:NADH-quinone oxidoreductase subunit N